MRAPICISMRARSWTWGSPAALWMTVEPGVRGAAISAFSVAITEGSSMKKSQARKPAAGARRRYQRSGSTSAPSARKASRWGSRRRRPITSPPGGGISARPKRASSGPASRKEARMRSASPRSTPDSGSTAAAFSATVCSSRHSTPTPRWSSSSIIAATSEMRGTLRTTTSSSVRRQAARMGSAPFLFPAGTTVPESGTPPPMTNFSMGARRPPAIPDRGLRRWARLTAMPVRLSRDEAWSLLTEWVESPSLRRHCLAVEAAMRAAARRSGADEELWGNTGLLHDLDYERHPDLGTGHPRKALELFEEMDLEPELIRGVASHADFLGVSRDSDMEKTLYAVDELCGFIVACAYVRPEGIHGMTPKSVKKKLKQASFAAAVNRDEVRAGAEGLGIDFDEHVRFVIAALEERADELGARGSAAAT